MLAFALPIFVGAFLLFQVQPLIAKFILPWFGGSPAVWTACMFFFQMLLLAGYAYAHLGARWLKPRPQVAIHLALLAGAMALLPITPSPHWRPEALENPTWHILQLLLACVGLPYFVLSATGPLLQDWFSRLNPGASPYRLYALSNLGSLLALISYPFGFEPAFTRQTQAALWAGGLVLFAALCGVCTFRFWRANPPTARDLSDMRQDPNGAAAPRPMIRILWFALPACASVLLLALTNKISQEIAVIPFLWVLPLSLYLLSFIMTFDSPRFYSRAVFGLVYLLMLVLVCYLLFAWMKFSMVAQIGIYAATLFVACMLCHGELYRLKPHPRHLTSYYLFIAAGGAAGGLFVTLLAPMLFDFYAEVHVGIWVCTLLLVLLMVRDKPRLRLARWTFRAWLLLIIPVIALGGVLVYHLRYVAERSVHLSRNFYGILGVYEGGKGSPEHHCFVLRSGQIQHGLQFVEPSRARKPTTYYYEESGVGLVLRHLNRPNGRKIGVVGLGTGTLSAYSQRDDRVRYYELNPEMARVAQRYFTYLRNSESRLDVVLGDARLSLEKEPSQQFDLLVLDAFTSDAIPVHLITREAWAIYLPHLKADGGLAVHLTNRYLDLQPVLEKLAAHFQLHFAVIAFPPRADAGPLPEGAFRSIWILLARERTLLDLEPIRRVTLPPLADLNAVALWTDDYTSLFELLK